MLKHHKSSDSPCTIWDIKPESRYIHGMQVMTLTSTHTHTILLYSIFSVSVVRKNKNVLFISPQNYPVMF